MAKWGRMTYAPYVYVLTFGICAIAIMLVMDYLERDQRDD